MINDNVCIPSDIYEFDVANVDVVVDDDDDYDDDDDGYYRINGTISNRKLFSIDRSKIKCYKGDHQ